MSNINVGVNVILVRDGKLLLGKRKNCFGAGEWGLPGGHLEYGENFEAAARRELKEETGLEAGALKFENVVNQPRSNEHYIQIAFNGEAAGGEPELCEPERCEAWQWFAFDALPENVFSAHRDPIRLFLKKTECFFE